MNARIAVEELRGLNVRKQTPYFPHDQYVLNLKA